MILAVANTKGGVGKTTLAVQIALARALAGREVWLIDGDRQGTASAAVAARAEAGRTPGLACAQYVDGPQLRTQVQQQRKHYTDIVIDVGGRDSSALRAALILADMALIPFAPRSFDVWALEDMAGLVEEARSVRDDLVAVAVLNLADPTGRDNIDAREAVAETDAFALAPLTLGRRKALAAASAAGASINEWTPRDRRACEEITALLSYLFNMQRQV